jgi:hypothetical protein
MTRICRMVHPIARNWELLGTGSSLRAGSSRFLKLTALQRETGAQCSGRLGLVPGGEPIDEGLGERRMPSGRNPQTSLPAAQRRRVDTQELREPLLREAPFPPVGE